MSKQAMREEAERLIRETMEKKALVVKQGNTRIETTCGKCGAPNRLQAEKGATRVKFTCKQCGHKKTGNVVTDVKLSIVAALAMTRGQQS